jgi:AraC family transcriptional regulator
MPITDAVHGWTIMHLQAAFTIFGSRMIYIAVRVSGPFLNLQYDCEAAIGNIPWLTDSAYRSGSRPTAGRVPGRDAVMLEPQNRTRKPDTIEFYSHAVQRAIGAIRQRLDEDISLADLASVAYMSRYHFNRTFREVTGLPPCRFVSKLRVEAATRLLLNSNFSVTEICMEVGYSSLGTFIRRFSRVLGVSPTKLRMLQRSPSKNLLECLQREATPVPLLQAKVVGQVRGPASFSGPIFIGLFPTPIPEGKPVACATILQPGKFSISEVPQRQYYVMALGMPWPRTVDDFFRTGSALRGGGQQVTIGSGTVECEDIVLREPATTDPPVLLNFPFLLGKDDNLRKSA